MFESKNIFVSNIVDLIKHLEDERSKGEFVRNVFRFSKNNADMELIIQPFVNRFTNASLINAKRFTYTSSIISLYGFLESYIEKISIEFIDLLNELRLPYNEVPKSIRRFHLDLSMDLLKKTQKNRTAGSEEKGQIIGKIVENMHLCTQGELNYKLNSRAFAQHSSNFRYDSIHEFFCRIGIDGVPRRSLDNHRLVEALARKNATDVNLDKKIILSFLNTELDDLAKKRNEIAHGSFDGSLESISILIDKINVINEFGISIASLLEEYFYNLVYLSLPKTALGICDRIFQDKQSFGFLANPTHNGGRQRAIAVGNYFFAVNENSDKRIKFGKIMSIVVNGVNVGAMTVPSIHDFSISVDFEIGPNDGKRTIFIA